MFIRAEVVNDAVGPVGVVVAFDEWDEGFGANLPAAHRQQHLQFGVLELQLCCPGVETCQSTDIYFKKAVTVVP